MSVAELVPVQVTVAPVLEQPAHASEPVTADERRRTEEATAVILTAGA
ncbi:hypothetical protein [Microvirga solisilvae]|nr:hypothetical protein [Microvirga solisilvae]